MGKNKNAFIRKKSGDVSKDDILMANQISNDSLLSKNDMAESAQASKRGLQPKFNQSGNPFAKLD